LFLNLDIIS